MKLKNKIKIIKSLPDEKKKQFSLSSFILVIIGIIVLFGLIFLIYKYTIPYINAVNINKITGKKIIITECNTKDYIIINKDKSYTMSLTNKKCEIEYYEGNVTIINNIIIFNKTIKGTIDKDYNIIINESTFKSDNEK